MNIIFISPNYPAGHRKYVAALRRAGHDVLGIGDAGEETFAPELRGCLSAYYRVGDLHDYDSVYRACCYYVWQHGRIEAIESLNPYWRDLVSSLRSEVCAAPNCPEKEYVRLAGNDMACAELTPRVKCATPKKACALAAQYGYPLLAVPAENKRLGSRLIVADAGVKSLLRGSTKGEYVFAAAPEGEPLSVDGLALGGKLVACAAHQRSEESQSVVCVAVDGLEARCQSLIDELRFVDGFFHIEAVRLTSAAAGLGKKGAVCFVAFEETPPHEYIIDLMSMEFGCDLRRTWAEKRVVMLREEPCTAWSEGADGSAGEQPGQESTLPSEPALPLERECFAAAAWRSFERSYKNLHGKVLRKLASKLSFHGRTEEPDRWAYSDYVYLFGGETAAELRRGVKFITEDHPLPKKPEIEEAKAPTEETSAE